MKFLITLLTVLLPASAQTSSPKLELKYDKPVVGAVVRVTGSGLPAGKTIDLVWGTVSGGWVIEDYFHFRGRKYTESAMPLGRFAVDAAGRLNNQFTVPEDFGGVHEITAMLDGKLVAQNGIEVTQSFEMTPLS